MRAPGPIGMGRNSMSSLWRALTGRATRPAAGTTAAEVRLQQMRQRVDVAQLAVLHSEEMRIGRAAAAADAPRAEGAAHHHGPDGLVDQRAAVGDVDAARHTDVAAVSGGAVARVHPTFGGISP